LNHISTTLRDQNMDFAEKRDAYIVDKDGKTHIFIGNLGIEVVEDDDQAGPLGWEDGQKPGIIFWEYDAIIKDKNSLKHSTGRPVAFKKLGEKDMNTVRELIKK